MREAFQQALQETEPQGSHLNHRNLQFIQIMAIGRDQQAPCEEGRSVDPGQLQKERYRARKLAERWNSYSLSLDTARQQLARLQGDWLVLRTALGLLPGEQQSLLIEEVARAMELGAERLIDQRLAYLRRAEAARPEQFVGLEAIPGLPWPSMATFFLHALEELAACSADEQQQLHQFLAGHPINQARAWVRELSDQLAWWFIVREQGTESVVAGGS